MKVSQRAASMVVKLVATKVLKDAMWAAARAALKAALSANWMGLEWEEEWVLRMA
jgi:hypothetical protein